MLDGRVLGASQVEYKPFGKPPPSKERAPPSKSAAVTVPSGTPTVPCALQNVRLTRLTGMKKNFGGLVHHMPSAIKQNQMDGSLFCTILPGNSHSPGCMCSYGRGE